MNQDIPIEISMTAGDWSLICLALAAKEGSIDDAIDGIGVEGAQQQLIKYRNRYSHLRKAISTVILDTQNFDD